MNLLLKYNLTTAARCYRFGTGQIPFDGSKREREYLVRACRTFLHAQCRMILGGSVYRKAA